jgi:hypothetical protein
MNLSKKEKQIHSQRTARYGDATAGHQNLGRIWAALLSQHYGIKLKNIPSRIVLLMFAASKLNRAAIEPLNANSDCYDDGKIYMELAKDAKRKELELESRKI